MTSHLNIYRDPGRYIESRLIAEWLVAVQPGKDGQAQIGAGRKVSPQGDVSFVAVWGYESVSQALAAWFAWDMQRQAEPQGYIWKVGEIQ